MRKITTEGIIQNLEARLVSAESDTDRVMEFHKWTNYPSQLAYVCYRIKLC